MRGVEINPSVNGMDLTDARFSPVGTAARELDAPCGFRPLACRGGMVSNKLVNKQREADVY